VSHLHPSVSHTPRCVLEPQLLPVGAVAKLDLEVVVLERELARRQCMVRVFVLMLVLVPLVLVVLRETR
jgi:hypothetical protein